MPCLRAYALSGIWTPDLITSREREPLHHSAPTNRYILDGNNNNNIQFLETHNTMKNSLYACEKSKYQTEIMIFQN